MEHLAKGLEWVIKLTLVGVLISFVVGSGIEAMQKRAREDEALRHPAPWSVPEGYISPESIRQVEKSLLPIHKPKK